MVATELHWLKGMKGTERCVYRVEIAPTMRCGY